MGQCLVDMGVHCVWTTRDRLPLITQERERALYRYITGVCLQEKCKVLAIGGMPDHVHLLVLLAPTMALSELVKRVKGGSSRYVSTQVKPEDWFGWQAGYAAFAVCAQEKGRLVAYIHNQKQHHAENTLLPSAEQTFDESEE